ncbi:hypothetical protein [Coxiella-like endosymbiont]|uniref:hypothetical protein n=1 Tax=Coxiella-like endosymbiont TaxID=1592897 RepID=UPI00272C78CA|nr:hypothetical protein [Coxiella-like endosymbiont]
MKKEQENLGTRKFRGTSEKVTGFDFLIFRREGVNLCFVFTILMLATSVFLQMTINFTAMVNFFNDQQFFPEFNLSPDT